MRMRIPPAAWSVARLSAAVVMIAAIVTQFRSTVVDAVADGRDVGTVVVNFLSFFTILSNAFGAVVLLIAVVRYWRHRGSAREPRTLTLALACATTYLAITGIVYNLLLRHLTAADAEVPWTNEVLHVIAPLFFLVDLLLAPGRRSLPWGAVLTALAFPLVWVGYTLARGPLVTDPDDGVPFWYPYPFLNPNGVNGWGGVTAYVIGIAIAFVVIGAIVVGVGKLRARAHAASHPAAVPAEREANPA
ncbi:Pr6Pr family membrane protein [Microbacterium sp. 179-B 1A2 NHS]|uniref:Pr6Pr family membrane protein n=1 Tax=Microbacterium sp. 179-B 1A2 NHS TaxID=3142383 RepID=UPI0039A342D9